MAWKTLASPPQFGDPPFTLTLPLRDKVGGGDGDEGGVVRLCGDGLCEEAFASARWPIEQDSSPGLTFAYGHGREGGRGGEGGRTKRKRRWWEEEEEENNESQRERRVVHIYICILCVHKIACDKVESLKYQVHIQSTTQRWKRRRQRACEEVREPHGQDDRFLQRLLRSLEPSDICPLHLCRGKEACVREGARTTVPACTYTSMSA